MVKITPKQRLLDSPAHGAYAVTPELSTIGRFDEVIDKSDDVAGHLVPGISEADGVAPLLDIARGSEQAALRARVHDPRPAPLRSIK